MAWTVRPAADLLSGLFRWHVPGRWYVFAVGYMAAAKLSAAAAIRVVNGEWPAFGSVPVYLMLLSIGAVYFLVRPARLERTAHRMI